MTRYRLPPLSDAQRRALKERLSELQYLDEQVHAEMRKINIRLARMPKGRTPRKEIEHATNSGYEWHRRHGIPYPEDEGKEPCGCREAHRLYAAWVRSGRRPTERPSV